MNTISDEGCEKYRRIYKSLTKCYVPEDEDEDTRIFRGIIRNLVYYMGVAVIDVDKLICTSDCFLLFIGFFILAWGLVLIFPGFDNWSYCFRSCPSVESPISSYLPVESFLGSSWNKTYELVVNLADSFS